MDYALNEVDDRVIELDAVKANQSTVNKTITEVSIDETTGIFYFKRIDGSIQQLDTLLEKVIINFDFDEENQKLIIYLEDGTTKEADLSVFIKPIEFIDSETVIWELLPEGKVKARVREGSINESHLRPEYLADIRVVQAAAQANQEAAENAENEAKGYAEYAELQKNLAKENAENAAQVVKEEVQVQVDEAKSYAEYAELQKNLAKENAENAAQVVKAEVQVQVDEAKSYANQAEMQKLLAQGSAETAALLVAEAQKKLAAIKFYVDDNDGHIYYETESDNIEFRINQETGNLEFQITA